MAEIDIKKDTLDREMTRVNHPPRPENTPVDVIFNGDCLEIMPTLPEQSHELWQGAIKRLGKKTLFDNNRSNEDDKPTRQMHYVFHSEQDSATLPGNGTV